MRGNHDKRMVTGSLKYRIEFKPTCGYKAKCEHFINYNDVYKYY